jgi:plastocyanin
VHRITARARVAPLVAAASAILIALASSGAALAADLTAQRAVSDRYFLPDASQSRIVSVAPSAKAFESKNAVKENGPAATVKTFGEVYGFSPNFIAVHRDQPLRLVFWNLQPDDEHDFMLLSPDGDTVMHEQLRPLTKNAWVFTFHKQGIFDFICAAHQPEMTGQILVLPPLPRKQQ